MRSERDRNDETPNPERLCSFRRRWRALENPQATAGVQRQMLELQGVVTVTLQKARRSVALRKSEVREW